MSLLTQISDTHMQTSIKPAKNLNLVVNLPQLNRLVQLDSKTRLETLFAAFQAVLASPTVDTKIMRVCEDICVLGQ